MLCGMNLSGSEVDRRRLAKRLLEYIEEYITWLQLKWQQQAWKEAKGFEIYFRRRVRVRWTLSCESSVTNFCIIQGSRLWAWNRPKVSKLCRSYTWKLGFMSLSLLGLTNSYSVQMVPLVLASNTYLVHTFIDLASSIHLSSCLENWHSNCAPTLGSIVHLGLSIDIPVYISSTISVGSSTCKFSFSGILRASYPVCAEKQSNSNPNADVNIRCNLNHLSLQHMVSSWIYPFYPRSSGSLKSQNQFTWEPDSYLMSVRPFLILAFHTPPSPTLLWSLQPRHRQTPRTTVNPKPFVALCMFLLDWTLDHMRAGFATFLQA